MGKNLKNGHNGPKSGPICLTKDKLDAQNLRNIMNGYRKRLKSDRWTKMGL